MSTVIKNSYKAEVRGTVPFSDLCILDCFDVGGEIFIKTWYDGCVGIETLEEKEIGDIGPRQEDPEVVLLEATLIIKEKVISKSKVVKEKKGKKK